MDSFTGEKVAAGDERPRHDTMNVDCSSKSEDMDSKTMVVTTLCPFLRKDDVCGSLRHPSYEVENKEKFCSSECLPHISVLTDALNNRGHLEFQTDVIIFRDVSNVILRQYCALCRPGCAVPEK